MDSDRECEDLASNQVGGGIANQDRGRGGLALESREGGAKILRPNQRSVVEPVVTGLTEALCVHHL